ncbi:hypothetical protein BD779DRAFT_1710281, partial [Infundibulicybe gibba]
IYWPFNGEPELGPTSSFLNFFERSSHLSVLTLDDLPASTTQLIDYLVFMPSLTSLDIKHTNKYVIKDELLQRLTFNHTNHLLPRLDTLSIRGQAKFCEGSLDALIVSRRNINPQDAEVSLLQNLVLDCSRPGDWPGHEPPSFHRFVSDGLNITYGDQWNIEHPTMDMINVLGYILEPGLHSMQLESLYACKCRLSFTIGKRLVSSKMMRKWAKHARLPPSPRSDRGSTFLHLKANIASDSSPIKILRVQHVTRMSERLEIASSLNAPDTFEALTFRCPIEDQADSFDPLGWEVE